MRHLAKIFSVLILIPLALNLGGCAYFQSTFGADTTDKARKAAGAAMTVYKESWQPLLAVYGSQPVCSATQKQPCQDAKLYRKLYDIDGQVATCTVAATLALNQATPDFSKVSDCVAVINNAELEFAKAGIVK